jgi:hypothetical protein
VPASPIELLTEQFYRWEQRGRGWQVWDYPVSPEPPFAPFRFHWVPPLQPDLDDGRRPTLFSRLTDRIVEALKAQAEEDEHDLPVLELDEPSPEEVDADGRLAELRVSMPAGPPSSRAGAGRRATPSDRSSWC